VLAEDSLPQVLKRLHAGAKLAVTAFDRSGTTQLATGTLAAIDSQINTSTGTVNLKAQFPNDDEALFPNQFVNVVLTVDEMQNVDVMPTAAIQRGAPGTFVYKVSPDGSAVSLQTVKLGPIDGQNVAVLSGLAVGDKVVIDGADKLRDGAKIAIRDASSAAPPASNVSGGTGTAGANAGLGGTTPAADTPATDQGTQQQGGEQSKDGRQRHRKQPSSDSSRQ